MASITFKSDGSIQATSFLGNASSATTCGDGSITVKAHASNEVNFGGTNTSGDIYFGYRATDSRPKPSCFHFGNNDASVRAGAVYGAVWNDLADCITIPNEDTVEPGFCYCMSEDGHYHKSSKYMEQSFIGIHSDTYGFAMGTEDNKNKLNAAVSGFVLAYVDQQYPVGTPLTCTENGILTKISKQDKIENPEMVLATYWKPEPNETWGTVDRQVLVNGRHWVKIK